MNKLVHEIEVILFRARWLLVPLYLGLVGALALLVYRFIFEFITLARHVTSMDARTFTLDVLVLLDLTLLGNLILMVIFAGYENFVSRIDAAQESKDRPHWMGTIDFSGKETIGQRTIGRIATQLPFVFSGVLFVVMDWIADKREFRGIHP